MKGTISFLTSIKLSSTMEFICTDETILLGGESLYTKTKVNWICQMKFIYIMD